MDGRGEAAWAPAFAGVTAAGARALSFVTSIVKLTVYRNLYTVKNAAIDNHCGARTMKT